MAKNKIVRAWVQQQASDIYVKQAHAAGYRSRAAYKLLALASKYTLFQTATTIIDLGCAPGSWLQVISKLAKPQAIIIGVDLLMMQPLARCCVIQGDFCVPSVVSQIITHCNNQPINLLLSDMSPSLSGISMVDQANSSILSLAVLDFAAEHLALGSNCIIKVFHGTELSDIVQQAQRYFRVVKLDKPAASRSASKEVYLVCLQKFCLT